MCLASAIHERKALNVSVGRTSSLTNVRALVMIMMTCTLAAIHSKCSKDERNKSLDEISHAAERLNCWDKADWMEAIGPRPPRPA